MDPVSNEKNNEQQQSVVEKSPEELARDAQAAALAKELGLDDTSDFEPNPEMTEEQQQAALKEIANVAETLEGSKELANTVIHAIEDGLQMVGHEKFAISERKKTEGVKALAPMIRKYAPNGLKLLGQYKDELMAGWWTATFAFGSVKQLKALKMEDHKQKLQLEELERQKKKDNDTVTVKVPNHAAH